MICCIDSNTYIWGIKKKAEQGQKDMIERASYLFKWMDENNYQIMLPTVVLAEVLAIEPFERHAVLLETINKEFIIADFDIRAASRYGLLFMNKLTELKKAAKQIEIDNQKMKTDHLIIASALVGGANCIYSHDKGLRAFGQKYIDIRDLPPLPPPKAIQSNLFNELLSNQLTTKIEDKPDDTPF